MSQNSICCPIQRGAMAYAVRYLQNKGYHITANPSAECEHLLLPVPSFTEGSDYLPTLLDALPRKVKVYGGFLHVPALIGYKRVDFLSDPYYLAKNAAITAGCTIQIVENIWGQDISGHSVLILGWGRIGKCLGKLLQQKGADVSIAARKDSDLAMIDALGYKAISVESLKPRSELIINTIPALALKEIPAGTVAIELASKPGMAGENIISARGLPGKMRPEESGKLIAETFMRLSQNQEEDL